MPGGARWATPAIGTLAAEACCGGRATRTEDGVEADRLTTWGKDCHDPAISHSEVSAQSH